MRESHHTTNQPTKVPTRRLALSLVEILLTVGIVGSLIMAMMSFFATTRGRYTRSEAYLNSAVLAQMVVERFRNEVSLNPELLATLSSGSGVWEFTGGAVDPGQASAPGRPLVDTFRWLFARGNEPLFGAVENEVSIRASAEVDSPLGAAMQSLLDNFRDYTIMIRIEDDKDLEPDPSGTPGPLKEMVKRVTVSTERASIVARDGEDPQAFILTTRVLTPVESLSGVAVEALRSNFDNYTLDQAWEEFFQVLSPSNPYFQMLSDSNRKLLADCYLILGYINGEAFLMDGTQLADGLVVTKAPATRTLNAWIDLLDDKNESNAYYRYPVFKRELVKLHTLKMKVIFDTFKALLPVLEHMAEAHEQLKPTFNELKLIMDSGLSLVAELNATTMEYMGSYREGEKIGRAHV